VQALHTKSGPERALVIGVVSLTCYRFGVSPMGIVMSFEVTYVPASRVGSTADAAP